MAGLQGYVVFWVGAYLVLGASAWLLDKRWGVPVRSTLANLFSKEPRAIDQGFLVGRRRRVLFSWCLAVAFVVSVLMILSGNEAWHFEMASVVPEAAVCFVGMHLGSAFGWLLRSLGAGLDKADELEAKLRSGEPLLPRSEPAPPALPAAEPPPAVDEQAAKIGKMDRILGDRGGDDA